MTPTDFINSANYIYHPVILKKRQIIFWKLLGLLLAGLTIGIVPTLFFSVFFDRQDHLNRRNMLALLKKHPYLLKEPIKVKMGIANGHLWEIDLRSDICWTEMGVFCNYNHEPYDVIFGSYLADRLQKHYDKELRKILGMSLKPKRSKKTVSTEI
jgi:hypothetical protein